MAIFPNDEQRTDEEGRESIPRAQSSKDLAADSPKEQGGENREGETKANEEEVSSKSISLPDLNRPCEEKEDERRDDDEIVLPSEGSNSRCLMNSDNQTPPAATSKLILKGCKACYFLFMIAENNQRCPKCGEGAYLIMF